jgi:hypothetical protein
MTKRQFKDEQYLRAEHLLKDGKYQAVTVEIADVVWNCPIKKGDKDTTTLGVAFVGSDKVLGLNRTNDSLICLQTGHGKPESWIGHKIQLVVRLVRNKKVEEPAIRVWPSKPIPNGRIRDQMGRDITSDWYGKAETKEQA